MSTNLAARICSRKGCRIRLFSSSVTVRSPNHTREAEGDTKNLTGGQGVVPARRAPIADNLDGIDIGIYRKHTKQQKLTSPINMNEFQRDTVSHDLAAATLRARVAKEGTNLPAMGSLLRRPKRFLDEQDSAFSAVLDAQPQDMMQIKRKTRSGPRSVRGRKMSREEKAVAMAKRTNIQNEGDEYSAGANTEEIAWDDEGFAIQTPFHLRQSDPVIAEPPIPTPPSLTVLSMQLYPTKDLRRQLRRRAGGYNSHFTNEDWEIVRNQKDAQGRVGIVAYASLALRKNPTLSRRRKELGVNTIKALMERTSPTVATTTP